MLVMAKERHKRSQQPKGRARDRGAAVPFTLDLDPALDEVLDACAGQERRTKRAIVTLALERYFTERGLWPPDSAGSSAESTN